VQRRNIRKIGPRFCLETLDRIGPPVEIYEYMSIFCAASNLDLFELIVYCPFFVVFSGCPILSVDGSIIICFFEDQIEKIGSIRILALLDHYTQRLILDPLDLEIAKYGPKIAKDWT